LVFTGESFALPPCPERKAQGWATQRFHNCYGTFLYFNGNKYIGEWKSGRRHGLGTFFGSRGAKFIGEFKSDGYWEGIEYSVSGEVRGTHSKNRWCERCKPTARQSAIVRKINPGLIATSPTPQPQPAPTLQSTPTYRLIGTGTGFAVDWKYVVTAEHVLDGCRAISIAYAHEQMNAQTVSRDKNNDLGLLKIAKSIPNTAKLRGSPDLRVGETAINYGYPLFGELSDSAKLNVGFINSLAGYDNDSSVIQYSAPTQPGNSGGPVLDQSGNVIGVVSSGLGKKYAEATGHIAQNVNFAVKSNIVENFLQSNNIPFQTAASTEKLELPDIAEKAETFTVLVGCWE
jgi:S1-C subfamily serine protease